MKLYIIYLIISYRPLTKQLNREAKGYDFVIFLQVPSICLQLFFKYYFNCSLFFFFEK